MIEGYFGVVVGIVAGTKALTTQFNLVGRYVHPHAHRPFHQDLSEYLCRYYGRNHQTRISPSFAKSRCLRAQLRDLSIDCLNQQVVFRVSILQLHQGPLLISLPIRL